MLSLPRSAPLALVLLVSVLLAACGGGDDGDADADAGQQAAAATQSQSAAADGDAGAGGDQSATQEDAAGEDDAAADADVPDDLAGYEADLRRIVTDVEAALDEAEDEFQNAIFAALADVDLGDEEAAAEAIAEVARDLIPGLVGIVEGGVAQLEDLDPPSRYAEDHAAFVRAVREVTELQDEALALLDDPLSAEEAFEELDRRQEEIEDTLRAAVSPEFAAIIEPFFSGADEPTFADGGDASDGDDGVFASGELPEDFPAALVPPDGELEFSATQETDGMTVTVAAWSSGADPGDLLDIYEAALEGLGLDGQIERLEFGDLRSVDLVSPGGEVLAGVVISPGEGEGQVSVLVTLAR